MPKKYKTKPGMKRKIEAPTPKNAVGDPEAEVQVNIAVPEQIYNLAKAAAARNGKTFKSWATEAFIYQSSK